MHDQPIQLPSATFCIMPWIHIYIDQQGRVGPCCEFESSNLLTDVRRIPIKQIPNSAEYQKLRLAMLAGEKPASCKNCWKREAEGLPSLRQGFTNKFKQFIVPHTDEDGTIDFKLRYVDARLSNLCNLKCRMCSGTYSSSIAQEENVLYKNSIYLTQQLTDSESADV
jgi:radical SAM protein with 4Fe4S-binding SPASM domain